MKNRLFNPSVVRWIFVVGTFLSIILSIVWTTDAKVSGRKRWLGFLPDTNTAEPTLLDNNKPPIDLQNPPNVERKVEYDPATRQYVITETIGGRFYRNPMYMSFEEYQKYEAEQSRKDYFKQRSNESSLVSGGGAVPKLYVNNQVFDRIFGGSKVDIRPTGSAELIFAGKFNRNDNPLLSERQRKTGNFDFDEKIQMNVVGSIGDKLKITTSYNTEATFDFENQMKIEYTGYEDEIIKKIELGNVSLPLNSSLISGSQSLFGVKTQLQFGKLTVTSVFSQQKSEKKQIKITNGAQTTEFRFSADNYEANKHFFLAQYFRDNYNNSLSRLPAVTSQVLITKVEVWVTNKENNPKNPQREIVALIDLGESSRIYSDVRRGGAVEGGGNPYPSSTQNQASNDLLDRLPAAARNADTSVVSQFFNTPGYGGVDNYAKLRARKLDEKEYTFNPLLGYISLNSALNSDEVLAVAYRYSVNGVEYTVGEFSNENPQQTPETVLFVKLLKNVSIKTSLPTWDLMMKNIYSLNAFQVNPQDFKLNVLYLDEKTSNNINYLPEGPANVKNIPLIQVLGLDRLDSRQQVLSDGVFDFIEGVTINAANGRIIFPTVEPFGQDLDTLFGSDEVNAAKYSFHELYDSTKFKAQQFPNKNKFTIAGSFQSTSNSEFSLNAINIPQGSVVVKSGTTVLTEGVDYTVDYNIGRVKIINQGILNSGTPITVDLESSSLFGVQTKTFFGSRFDYKVNDKLNLGGTFVRLSERPITQKVNIGDESIANNMYGFDFNYRTESPFLTSLVDKIPLINTKAPSTVTVSGEYARLDPGHSRFLNTKNNKKGLSYVDDFEGSKSVIDLRNPTAWQISSTPFGFTGYNSFDLTNGYDRARLAFYQIDQLFYSKTNSATPNHIKNDRNQLSNHYVREVTEQEVFPNRQTPTGEPNILSTLDLAYYPREKGPYNFRTTNLDGNGKITNPRSMFGGITRRIESNDFEALNVDYIEFWLMDPFIYNTSSTGGEIYVDLGSISEDVLKDDQQEIENALPKDGNPALTKRTVWGKVGTLPPLTNSFDNDPNSRKFQDIGLEGLNDDEERQFYASYLTTLQGILTPEAYNKVNEDPSNDDFRYFRGGGLDNEQASILERYRLYNNLEGNTPTEDQSKAKTGLSNTASTPNPDTEDINRDNSKSDRDEYFQYRIPISPDALANPDENSYITDKVVSAVKLANGQTENVTWYQFKIPLRDYEDKIGEIEDFRSIRFVRAFLTNFADSVVLRFARFQLVRGEWRKLDANQDPGIITRPVIGPDFDISTVNIEENGNRTPIPYVLPPGVEQEQDVSNVRGITKINEQSLALNVCNLGDGEYVGAYKNTSFDFRSYKRIEMFIHAEGPELQNNQMSAYIRFGADFDANYYEYEIPLVVTPEGAVTADQIWPDVNKLDIPFSVLQIAKQTRNSSGASLTKVYEYQDGRNKIKVLGNPDLSNVRTIVIGLRNPLNGSTADPSEFLCGEVWFDELRVSGFDEQGGWAATGRVELQMADLAKVTLSGSRSTIGFGSIDKKVSERNKTDDRQYDVSTNVELGKFVPEKVGMKIPMYVSYSEAFSRPQFSPNSPDILLANVLKELPKDERDSLKKISETYTKRKSINFSNVQKTRTDSKRKPRVYDVENLNATYLYSETYNRSYNTEYAINKTYKASLGYNYSNQAENIKPFDKIITNDNLKLIKDFNFYTRPNGLDFRIDVDRNFSESKTRNINNSALQIKPYFAKDFRMTRLYGLRYDITRSLKFDFSATNQSIIDEPYGRLEGKEKDTVLERLLDLGRDVNYSQNVNLTYAVPINKLPYLDWTTWSVSYSARYDWEASPLATSYFHNTISNSQAIQVNPQLNFTTLYNKSKYLRNIITPKRSTGGRSANNPLDKLKVTSPEQAKKDSIEKAQNRISVSKILVRTLVSLRTVNISYKETNGILLPGYIPQVNVLGYDFQHNAPGFGFILGSQEDIRPRAVQNGWLIQDSTSTNRYTTTERRDLNIRANLELVPDMKIDLTAQRSIAFNHQEYFRYNFTTGTFQTFAPTTTGNFSMSVVTIRTAFERLAKNGSSKAFQTFEDYRLQISERLASERGITDRIDTGYATGYYEGYNNRSQQVLIPAFLAAYSGRDPEKVTLNPFPKIPLPNWRINYTGLSKLDIVKEYLNNITINHGYISTYSVNSFLKPMRNSEDTTYPATGNFIPEYEISQVSISEQFSPLIGFDVTTKQNITITIDYKQSRNLGMSFVSARLEQLNTKEYVFGIGYTTSNLKLPVNLGKGQVLLKNDLNFKLDFSIRYNRGVVHRFDINQPEIISGSRVISIKPSVDYVINQRFQIKLFYDRLVTKPFISTTFPTAITSLGFSIRINIGS